MSVLMLRHGPTAYNAGNQQERHRAWLDLPLSVEGQHIAAVAGERLAEIDLVRILSSDIQQAQETAEPWAFFAQKPLTFHRELRTWNLGDLSGQPVSTTQPILDRLVETTDVPAPGGESFQQFLDRYLPFILPLVRSSQLFGVVSHGRNLKALRLHLESSDGRISPAKWRDLPFVNPGQAMLFTADDCSGLDKRRALAAHSR